MKARNVEGRSNLNKINKLQLVTLNIKEKNLSN
jgi:hypothetical protein